MSELPEGWELEPIHNLFEVVKDTGREGVVPYLEIGNVNIETKKYEFTDKPSVKGCKSAKRGDVLISRVRPTRGAITQVEESILEVSSAFTVIRNTYGMQDRYLWLYLAWNPNYLNYLGNNCTGTMYPTVSEDVTTKYKIPLAPANEQRRIVAKLEKLMNRAHAAQARLSKIPRIIKQFRQSVLAAACTGRLTANWRKENPNVKFTASLVGENSLGQDISEDDLPSLPDSWRWVALGNYAKCSRGRFSVRPRNDPSYFGGRYPFIQIGNIPSEGGLITSHNQTLNEKGLTVSKMFRKGTVVIAIVGATIGNTGILSYDMCFTDSMVGIETGSEVGNKYVELFLRYRKNDIRQSSYAGGGQPNIKLEVLNPYPLALPPFAEQQEIVRRVEALFKTADALEARYRTAKAYVDKLIQSILARAFRGELVTIEAELARQEGRDYEPASVLLERIRQERAQQESTPKQKPKRASKKQARSRRYSKSA
jgi:type I restriction enzyme S subunit